PLRDGLADLPAPLLVDLTRRFPDPLYLLGPDGRVLRTLAPDAAAFAGAVSRPDTLAPLDDDPGALLQTGEIVVTVSPEDRSASWGLAPVYDADGFLAGGLLVRPLLASVARELAGARAAFV